LKGRRRVPRGVRLVRKHGKRPNKGTNKKKEKLTGLPKPPCLPSYLKKKKTGREERGRGGWDGFLMGGTMADCQFIEEMGSSARRKRKCPSRIKASGGGEKVPYGWDGCWGGEGGMVA